jgi:transcriptional regulator NrdR family protein
MAKEVIKKDGTKEPFDAEKIENSIAGAAIRTDLSDERRSEVVGRVASSVIQMTEGKEEIATSEIREKILSELDIIEPAVAESWRKYEEEKKGV